MYLLEVCGGLESTWSSRVLPREEGGLSSDCRYPESPHEVPQASREPPLHLRLWVLTIIAWPSPFPHLAFLLPCQKQVGTSDSWWKSVGQEHELLTIGSRFLFSLVSGTSSVGEDEFPLRLWPPQSIVYLLSCDAALFPSWLPLGWRSSSVLSCSVEWWAHSH